MTQVQSDLAQLQNYDLTILDQPEPELAYLFKHLITHQVAYESLPYATRSMKPTRNFWKPMTTPPVRSTCLPITMTAVRTCQNGKNIYSARAKQPQNDSRMRRR